MVNDVKNSSFNNILLSPVRVKVFKFLLKFNIFFSNDLLRGHLIRRKHPNDACRQEPDHGPHPVFPRLQVCGLTCLLRKEVLKDSAARVRRTCGVEF